MNFFERLRAANIQRLPLFPDAHGQPAHLVDDGSDWAPDDWHVAVMGEVGETFNLLKKYRRGDYLRTDNALITRLMGELADIIIYMDILAYQSRSGLVTEDRESFSDFVIEHQDGASGINIMICDITTVHAPNMYSNINDRNSIITILNSVASHFGINLESAVIRKFNETSQAVGVQVFMS